MSGIRAWLGSSAATPILSLVLFDVSQLYVNSNLRGSIATLEGTIATLSALDSTQLSKVKERVQLLEQAAAAAERRRY